MVALKLLGIFATSAGIGFPIVSSFRENSFPKASEMTEQAKSALKVKWMGGEAEEKLETLLRGLGKVVDNKEGKKEEILGLEIKSWGTFEDDICQKLGFSGTNSLTSGISCEKSNKQ
ncbi:hypothetical protein [Mycoplasma suis]|uniref:Uncharacterized protein n=1 Tax=Mycoplasma suis (strain Illinois) TaxID=768700 RepID=F0QQT7_MYCSL|nr:hypothetical protein [Mycoplasma suis]ADX97857.1 hypothetical protein MSU_0315 [Mycoplasma suis str. Illinois]